MEEEEVVETRARDLGVSPRGFRSPPLPDSPQLAESLAHILVGVREEIGLRQLQTVNASDVPPGLETACNANRLITNDYDQRDLLI